ncbi:MAG: adenylyl cyclase, partial [Opitutus sp.]
MRGNPRFEKLLRDTLPKGAKPFDDPKAAASPAVVDDKSVAVLAFANLSDDKNNEYFSDGISEELLNVLAKVPGLKVTARTSSFHFKGKDTPIPEIAQQLGVAYVVEGSVRKQGDKVRITAQLSKAADGFHVWNDTFTRDLKDVFAVQDEIAGLIAKNLSVRMGVSVRAEHQINPDALAVLLEGRHYWTLRTTEGFARAEALFNRAVTLDPQWAPAHAALASLLAIQASYQMGGGEAANDRFEQATREARRAIELDATLGEPQATLGKIAMKTGGSPSPRTIFARRWRSSPTMR